MRLKPNQLFKISILIVAICTTGLPAFTKTCESLFRNQKATFAELLLGKQWNKASAILQKEKDIVASQLENLSWEERSRVDKHWAGVFSGEVISSDISRLTEISNYMKFKDGQSLIDIGSGHGDPGIVFGSLNPGLHIVGYEIVTAKVKSANRIAQEIGLKNVKFLEQDLSDPNFHLPRADYYYLFNPVYPKVVEALAKQIQTMSEQQPQPKVIVYGGSWTPRTFENLGFRRISRVQNNADTVIYQYSSNKESPVEELVAKFITHQDSYSYRLDRVAKGIYRAGLSYGDQTYLAYQAAQRKFIERNKKNRQALKSMIVQVPATDRMSYLRNLSKEELIERSDLLDSLFGLDMPTEGQVPWSRIFRVMEDMNLRPGQIISVSRAGVSRLGFLIGLLQPDVLFTGIELVDSQVRKANAAAWENGFRNIRYTSPNSQ